MRREVRDSFVPHFFRGTVPREYMVRTAPHFLRRAVTMAGEPLLLAVTFRLVDSANKNEAIVKENFLRVALRKKESNI
jgi:hypothetical protein